MHKIGIIAEYNPFHKGHAYMIDTIKSSYPDSAIIAVMSGDFTQRGEIAIYDKYYRAKKALEGGVDLVAMLPASCSLQSAQGFARAGISLLKELGCTHIAFGAEDDNLTVLKSLADTDIAKEDIAPFLKEGMSYPAAVERFYKSLGLDCSLAKSPNNTLAIEYLRAIRILKVDMTPILVKRYGAGYNSTDIDNPYPSAMAIRQALISGHITSKEGFVADTDLDEITLYSLKKALYDNSIRNIRGYHEYLENKLRKEADYTDVDSLITSVKSKDITYQAIKRHLCCILLGITQSESYPEYIRILGFTQKGQLCIRDIKGKTSLPVITTLAEAKSITSLTRTDDFAHEIYKDAYQRRNHTVLTPDYKRPPIIYDFSRSPFSD